MHESALTAVVMTALISLSTWAMNKFRRQLDFKDPA
jgi:hypothetical protein